MHDDAPPTLYPSATELWQYAQAITSISALSGRIRANLARVRERDGRLAFAEDEHAARQHEARQHPPIRPMTDEEAAAWQARVPAALAAQAEDGPCSVWTARMVDADGAPTGEWGLQARSWTGGTATGSLLVVCRDAEDALGLTRHLREHGNSDELARLQLLATSSSNELAELAAPTAAPYPGQRGVPAVLSAAEWEAALRSQLPPALADRIIVADPAHPHHAAWRELHQLANAEVVRAGADPARLAQLVHRVPRWRDDVSNPPALAHWAITQARSAPGYHRTVNPGRLSTTAQHTAHAATPPVAPRLTEVHTPEHAVAWARGLAPADPAHRVEAKQGFGRWGSTVDAILVDRFPSVVEQANTAVRTARTRQTSAKSRHQVAQPAPDPVMLAELAAEVERLDPTKPIDRRAARVMLGRVPVEIDRLLAEKFADDPQFVDKLQTLYPDGLPEAEATEWRTPATGADGHAAAQVGTGDNPRIPQREDIAGQAAGREHALAAQQRGMATALASHQPATTHQPVPAPAGPRRRA